MWLVLLHGSALNAYSFIDDLNNSEPCTDILAAYPINPLHKVEGKHVGAAVGVA